jgi:hypothetical protein
MACLSHSASTAADPIPFGEPGVRPSYAPDRDVRLERIELAVHLEPAAATFRGRATLQFAPYPKYAGVATFDLDEVVVERVTDGAGAELGYEHGDGKLRVRAGDQRVVVVTWSGRSPRRGLYFVGPAAGEPDRPSRSAWTQCQDEDAHFVCPCHDHPSGEAHPWSGDARRAPAGHTLLSNGRLRGGGGDASRGPGARLRAGRADAGVPASPRWWREAGRRRGATAMARPVRYLVPAGRHRGGADARGRWARRTVHDGGVLADAHRRAVPLAALRPGGGARLRRSAAWRTWPAPR